jgi:Uma2 family endonuclease
MVTATHASDIGEEDQHVVLYGMSWQDFEAFLAIRGERSGVRMFYLDGAIEIMSPTKIHEGRKKTLARLLEQWALETGVRLHGFGSWTLKSEVREAGGEPDECYIIDDPSRDVPDLVIEVEYSRVLGLNKREIYRRLRVRELWTLKKDGSLKLRVLEDEAWVERDASSLFPQLDIGWLVSFLDLSDQHAAVVALRDALRGTRRP